jgi:hypothetical protein
MCLRLIPIRILNRQDPDRHALVLIPIQIHNTDNDRIAETILKLFV